VNLAIRALEQGWISVEEAERLVPQRLIEILQRRSPRGWIAAMKFMDAMRRTTLASIETHLHVMESQSAEVTADSILDEIQREEAARSHQPERNDPWQANQVEPSQSTTVEPSSCPTSPTMPEPRQSTPESLESLPERERTPRSRRS
jgi:hypothetical protein